MKPHLHLNCLALPINKILSDEATSTFLIYLWCSDLLQSLGCSSTPHHYLWLGVGNWRKKPFLMFINYMSIQTTLSTWSLKGNTGTIAKYSSMHQWQILVPKAPTMCSFEAQLPVFILYIYFFLASFFSPFFKYTKVSSKSLQFQETKVKLPRLAMPIFDALIQTCQTWNPQWPT